MRPWAHHSTLVKHYNTTEHIHTSKLKSNETEVLPFITTNLEEFLHYFSFVVTVKDSQRSIESRKLLFLEERIDVFLALIDSETKRISLLWYGIKSLQETGKKSRYSEPILRPKYIIDYNKA
nr:unnamed protein product [Callosobruchus chinensis]